MRKSQCLLFALKLSYICCYIICMTVPLIVADEKAKSIPVDSSFGIWNFLNFYVRKGMPYSEECKKNIKLLCLN